VLLEALEGERRPEQVAAEPLEARPVAGAHADGGVDVEAGDLGRRGSCGAWSRRASVAPGAGRARGSRRAPRRCRTRAAGTRRPPCSRSGNPRRGGTTPDPPRRSRSAPCPDRRGACRCRSSRPRSTPRPGRRIEPRRSGPS
jgi:hypothetical protein